MTHLVDTSNSFRDIPRAGDIVYAWSEPCLTKLKNACNPAALSWSWSRADLKAFNASSKAFSGLHGVRR